MPNKKINQLDSRVIAATDLMLVGDPSTGVSFKSLVSGLGAIYVPNSRTLTINGTTYDLSDNRTWNVGTVTSVNMSVPTGLTISGNPITGSGTLALALASGYTIPTQALLDGKVPYIGATGNVDLGEYELKAGQLTLDVSPTGTAVVGTTRWNNTIGSTETTLKGGTVVLKNGVDLVARVVNKVSPNATLTKAAYQAVRVTGAQGQRLAVAYAQANNDNNSADTIGLVCETIATNQEGFIITVGQLENINTTGSLQGETWNDGDVLYLSPTTPGAITNIKPAAPQHLVVIGYVEYAHANNGKIYVKVMNGWELGELHDVNTTGAVNGNVLKYNGSIWVPSSDIDTGITSINGLTALSQTFATGTTGTDFNIGSAGSTHTFNIPSASAINRGALTSADFITFNNKQNAGNYITALTGEVTASGPGSAAATLLNSAVIGKVLTGLNLTGGGTILATDSILQAFGKTQNQISALVGGVMYEGVWNASTNTPAIVSGVGSKGDYYVVSVAGSINIDGISDWKIGDWIIFNGTNWDKVDNTDAVSSVNGFTGAVSLTTANISEVTNLYFTDARVMSAMLTGYTIGSNTAITFNDSVLTAFGKAQAQINTKQNIITLTTTGSSGSATFVSDTLNVPTYTLAGLGGQPQLNGTGFVKVTGTTISYDNSTYYLASNPNSFIALTALSAGTGISYNNTNGVITNTAPDQVVSLTAGNGISISGTYPSFTIASTITQYTDALARLAISESVTGLDYDNTTGVFSLTTGYVIPTTSSAANWDSAYNDKINSASVTGTTTKTLTLTQQDGGTITASWTDINTDAVNSVFGRTGAVVAVSGDYTTAQVTESGNLYYTDARARAAITLTTTGSSGSSTYSGGTLNIPAYTLSGLGGVPTTRTLTINGTAYDLSADRTWNVGTVTSATATTGGQVAFFNGATVITSVSGLYFDGVDKLGIGTASPTYNLDVTGDARMISSSSSQTLYLQNSGTGYGLYNQADSYFQGDVEFQSVTSTLLKVDASHKLIAAVAGTDYQAPITNPVTGTGTTNNISKWTSGSSLGSSEIYDVGNNVGISTNNPVVKLQIKTATNINLGIQTGTTDTSGIKLNSFNDAGSANIPIEINGSILILKTNENERSRFTSTGNLLVNSVVDNGNRLQVTGNGYFSGSLGVGTASPAALLHVNSTGTHTFIYSTISGSSAIALDNQGGDLRIFTGGAERMRLDASGNLGIGTSSPQVPLSIASSGNNWGLFIGPDAGGATGKRLKLGYYGTANHSVIQSIQDGVTTTSLVLQPDGGNLGLGVVPSAWGASTIGFDIGAWTSFAGVGGSSFMGFNSYSTSTSAFAYKNTGAIALGYQQTTAGHNWYTAPSGTAGNAITFTQAMTLTASGRLLLGTTTEGTYLLDVNGTGRFSGRLDVTGTTNYSALKTTNTSGNIYWGVDNSTGTDFTGVAYARFIYSEGAYPLITYVNGAERMRIASTGAATFSSSVTATSLILGDSNNLTWGGSYGPNIPTIVGVSGASGYVAIYPAGSTLGEKFRFTNGGNLLVGTTTDSGEKLQVSGSVKIASSVAGAFNAISLTNSSNSSSARNIIKFTNDSINVGYLEVFSSTWGATGGGDDVPDGMRLFADGSGGLSVRATNGSIRFYTGSTERLVIKSNGIVNISNVPSSSAGLSSGDIYKDASGFLKIV